MNRNAERINNALKAYVDAKNGAKKQIEIEYEVHGENAGAWEAEKQEKRLATIRASAMTEIESAYNAGVASAREWGKLQGGDLTDDIKLLQNDLVDETTFEDLKARYQNNAVMLTALKQYGDRKNRDRAEALRAEGKFPTSEGFAVRDISTLSDKLQNWEKMKTQAFDMLDAVDGVGNYAGDNSVLGEALSAEVIGKIGEGVDL